MLSNAAAHVFPYISQQSDPQATNFNLSTTLHGWGHLHKYTAPSFPLVSIIKRVLSVYTILSIYDLDQCSHLQRLSPLLQEQQFVGFLDSSLGLSIRLLERVVVSDDEEQKSFSMINSFGVTN